MSEKRFLETLQALLTMVDPGSVASRACVKNVLESIAALARESRKCNSPTIRMIYNTQEIIDHLIDHREDFAGKPGEYQANVAKLQQLRLAINPGC